MPTFSTAIQLPGPRKAGALSRPHQRKVGGCWRWIDRSKTSSVIAAGDPFFDESVHLSRRTPTGLTESELLASLNYLDGDALTSFDGIGMTLATNIIDHRAKSQYFASLDELALVPKIGAKRFANLTGREPQVARFRLHDLMRHSRLEDIHLADLQPWHNPAPGIVDVHVHPKNAEVPPAGQGQNLVVSRLRRFNICFYSTESLSGGRAEFIYKNLPDVLRPLLS
jgi:hypothetical protein